MRLSIVIPTYREARVVEGAVARARTLADEVIVADASDDDTAPRAAAAGATVVRCAHGGRGAQLREGAARATGDVLLFVHADVALPRDTRRAIEHALADEAVVGGNFGLRFTPETVAAKVFTVANDVRRRAFAIYYGDSAIFVRTSVYHAIGGFEPLPLFEDLDLVRRLERAGRTVYLRRHVVEASARRFAHAPLRTLAMWTFLQCAYSCGVPPERLARLYAHRR